MRVQLEKRGGLRCGSGQKKGVFTTAHTYTEHICEYPPPPPPVTTRPCPPGAKEGVRQLQELERSLNRGRHGLFLPNLTEVNTSRSPDTWKEPTCSMEPNEGWRRQELRSTLQRKTNIPAQICRVVELPGYFKNDYTQCMSPIYELCVFIWLYPDGGD